MPKKPLIMTALHGIVGSDTSKWACLPMANGGEVRGGVVIVLGVPKSRALLTLVLTKNRAGSRPLAASMVGPPSLAFSDCDHRGNPGGCQGSCAHLMS